MQLFIKFYIYKLFQIFAYIFLSRTSKLTGNRQTDFLLLNNLRFAFSCVRNFLSLLRAYSLIILLICSLKFNLESIVIPSSLTDETDFVNILPICNVSESVFPRIINQNISGVAFIDLYTSHSYTFYVFCIGSVTTRIKAFVASKITEFTFCCEKKQIIDKNIIKN